MSPQSGTSPISRNDTVNFALSPATTTSARQAMLAPAPAACPCTAATTGFGKVMAISATRTISASRSSMADGSRLPIVLTSPPAQKCPPAPVTTTARTAASSAMLSKCSANPLRVSGESAFRASGRSMVRTATPPPRSSRRKVMVGRLLRVPVGEWGTAVRRCPHTRDSSLGNRHVKAERSARRSRGPERGREHGPERGGEPARLLPIPEAGAFPRVTIGSPLALIGSILVLT